MTGQTTGVILPHTIFSNNFGMADKIDIPQYQDTSRLLPLLNKATTKYSFQMAGKTTADSDKLKTNVKGTDKRSQPFQNSWNSFRAGSLVDVQAQKSNR
jgi:hypothetical protein